MKPRNPDDQYFYVQPVDVLPGNTLILRGEEALHCSKVLRKTAGNLFFAVDGLGNEFLVELKESQKDQVVCQIVESKYRPHELSFDITLAQALIKKDRLDIVVEKSTELGAHSIIPVETERSLVEPGYGKIQRWQKIIVSAMKQSKRSVIPCLGGIVSFKDVVENSDGYDIKVIFHEKSDRPAAAFVKSLSLPSKKILLLIGPEGGFTESENRLAVDHDFVSLSLGARRLRAETAAICAVSLFSNFDTL